MRYQSSQPFEVEAGRGIVIRSNNWIGDAIMSTPAIRAVRKRFPQSRISVVAKSWVIPVYEFNPDIDEIIHYEQRAAKLHFLDTAWGALQLVSLLRKGNFKAAITFRRAFESAFLPFLARIPLRMGYATDGRGPFLTHKVSCKKSDFNEPRPLHDLKLVEGFGIPATESLVLELGEEQASSARERLRSMGVENDTKLIALIPGSKGGIQKRWSPLRFIELSRRLAKRYDATVLIFGANFERALGIEIKEALSDCAAINLAGETSLSEAIALLAHTGLALSNDSGLMHAAAALDVPLVAVFGPTDVVKTAPWSRRKRVVRREETSCDGCSNEICRHNHECMERISVLDVEEQALSLVEECSFDTLAERVQRVPISTRRARIIRLEDYQ
jgi:heptosyltransferase-2